TKNTKINKPIRKAGKQEKKTKAINQNGNQTMPFGVVLHRFFPVFLLSSLIWLRFFVDESIPLGPGRQIHLGVAEELGRLLRRYRVDVEAGAPLEAGDACQPRDHLDVPMIVRQRLRVERRRVDD